MLSIASPRQLQPTHINTASQQADPTHYIQSHIQYIQRRTNADMLMIKTKWCPKQLNHNNNPIRDTLTDKPCLTMCNNFDSFQTRSEYALQDQWGRLRLHSNQQAFFKVFKARRPLRNMGPPGAQEYFITLDFAAHDFPTLHTLNGTNVFFPSL